MSTPRLRAGMMVEIVGLTPFCMELNGKRFVLSGGAEYWPLAGWSWRLPEEFQTRFIHVGVPRMITGISERHLKPINDGDLPARWEDCAWRPREVEAV